MVPQQVNYGHWTPQQSSTMKKRGVLRRSVSAHTSLDKTVTVVIIIVTMCVMVKCRKSREEMSDIDFFNSIAALRFGVEDVIAMYKNVTAVIDTVGCKVKCRTPLALYVINRLMKCQKIDRADCPKGFACCKLPLWEIPDHSNNVVEVTTVNVLDSEEINTPPGFVQDKIPGDSDEDK